MTHYNEAIECAKFIGINIIPSIAVKDQVYRQFRTNIEQFSTKQESYLYREKQVRVNRRLLPLSIYLRKKSVEEYAISKLEEYANQNGNKSVQEIKCYSKFLRKAKKRNKDINYYLVEYQRLRRIGLSLCQIKVLLKGNTRYIKTYLDELNLECDKWTEFFVTGIPHQVFIRRMLEYPRYRLERYRKRQLFLKQIGIEHIGRRPVMSNLKGVFSLIWDFWGSSVKEYS